MSIIRPKGYSRSNPRLNGVRLLDQIKSELDFNLIDVMNAHVITDESFRYYLENKELSDSDLEEINARCNELFKISKNGLLAVRRAYLVPNLSNPPGPRFLGLKTNKEVIAAVKAVFDFAIEQNYHHDKDSLIEIFFYPFFDPPKIKLPISENTVFPKGGYAVPLDDKFKSIRVLAVYGNNEGVQSLKGFDEYIVDSESLIITEKKVRQKNNALCTTDKSQDELIDLPLGLQFKQVLNDLEILEVALFLQKAMVIENKLMRIEFSFDDSKIGITELIDYELEEIFEISDAIEGEVIVVENETQLDTSLLQNKIIYISNDVVKNRDYLLLNKLANIKIKLNILYPGSTATAHAMRVLVDKGHNAFVVGEKHFSNHDIVNISSINGLVEIKKIHSQSNIIPLSEANELEINMVGGKAYNLGRLLNLNYKVPNGYVITSKVSDNLEFFESVEFKKFLEKLDQDKLYSVRSSADVEDSAQNAFAGQFESYLHVSVDKISEMIKSVWDSSKSEHVTHLLKDLNIEKANMAVVIQEMIEPQFSGVIFGANIESRNTDQVTLEVVNDYADKVVDGVAKSRKIIFDKFTSKVVLDSNKNGIDISESLISILFDMYIKLEENFNNLQDVEWTIGKNSQIYLLQTRDLIV